MARINGQGGHWIRNEKRLAIYLRDGFTCAYCGRDLRTFKPCEVGLDHLVCSSAQGSNDPTNLVTSCRSCNSTRGTKPWMEFATGGAIERIQVQRFKPLNMELATAMYRNHTPWADR